MVAPLYQHAPPASRALDREEECALVRRAQGGDVRARAALVESTLGLVFALAWRHRRPGVAREDLVQEGVLGVLQAISHFDASKRASFHSYAAWWVRAYVLQCARVQMGAVRGGAARGHAADLSLSDDAALGERVLAQRSESVSVEEAAMRRERARQLTDALAAVKQRIGAIGWDIVQNRLGDDEPRTLKELGARWGLSRERIRQIEKQTLAFLRRYLASLAP